MDIPLRDQLIIALQQNKNSVQFLSIFNSIPKQDLIEMLSDILLHEQSFPAAIVMFDIIELLDDFQKKLQCEVIFLKLMSNFKECKQDNIQTHAEIIGALLRRFNKHLSITQQDLFSFLLAQQREKQIKGLILIKEITSLRQGFKYLVSNSDYLSILLYKAGQANIHFEIELIDALINKWEKSKQNDKIKSVKQKQKDDFDINLLLTCCLIQSQKAMNNKQKKMVYPLVITQINADKYLEEDKYLLYHYLYFLKSCDKNFIQKREKFVFQKLNKLLKMFEIEQFNITREDIEIQGNSSEEKKQEFQLYQSNINNSINLFLIFANEVIQNKFTKTFIPEMVNCMFSLCEHLDIKSKESQVNTQLLDFKWIVEYITLSEKKLLINEIVFQKIQNNIKAVGEGNLNKEISNQVDYSQEEVRVLIGTYNMLFFWIFNNLSYIRQIESIFCKFLGCHLKNPYLKYNAIKCLYSLFEQAFYLICYNHEYFMENLIDIFQNIKDFSSNNSQLVVQIFEIIFQKYNKNASFLLQYVPRVYQICLEIYPLICQDNSCSDCFQNIESIICSILQIDEVEYYISKYLQLSKETFLRYSNTELDQSLKTLSQNQEFSQQDFNLSCLSGLANMVLKSQCFKDEDLVANIKSLLRTFANQIYQGKYDNFMKIRAQIYDFIQNIKLKLLNDNSFIDELFLKLFPRLITDLDINTNFIVKKKNIDSEHEQEDQEEEEHDQLEFVVLDIPLVNYKLKSIQLLGHFINQCPKIVIENKKFEIMTKIMKTLMNEREEYTVIHFNFKNLAKMFKCVRSYYLQYLPDLYLNNNEAVSEENKFLSEEAKVEYAPLFDFMLEQICSIEQLNYESEIEDLSYLIYKILKCTDNPTKRTFFQQIFQAIKYFMKKTKHILNTQIIEWSLAGLKLIYKAFPSQLQNNFLPIWKSLVSSLNQQKAPLNDSDEDSNDYNGDNDGDHSYSSEQQMEIQENSEQLEQGSINGSDNSYISLEEDEEGVNQISNEESQSQSNLQNEENKTQDQYIFKMLKIDITKIDIQLVSEIIGSVASFVKYDKCVYPIISDLINEIILNKKYIKIEMVQRNTFYYLNKITRYCFDSIQPDLFKKFYEIVKNTAESYQGYTDLNKKDIIENIYITYAFMTVKLVENKLPLEYTKSDYNCFNKLFSLVPFEGDYTEMQRVIKICNFLLEKNSSIIEQNLYNITLSVIYIIYDPSKYHVKSSKEQFYSEFYDKIVVKFPQAKSIAKSIIDLNKGNVFNQKQQILSKLKII